MLDQQSAPAVGSGSNVSPLDIPTVAEMFATVFERETIDADDDFFALGGDSLIATALVAEIENRTGVSLSISVLIDSATPRLLAATIADTRRANLDSILIPVRPAGEGPAIFSVHGMAGDDLFTHRLAEQLEQNRPIWGVRAKGLTAGEHPVTSIPAMADLYLAGLRSIQPEGPYILMGHCGVGVMVVWDMAQKILASGGRVAGLLLLEPGTNKHWAPFLFESGFALQAEISRALRTAAETSAWFEANPDATGKMRKEHVDTLMTAAVGSYVPKPIPCPVLLVCRKERALRLLDSRRGYPGLAKDLQIFTVDATHLEMLKERLDESLPAVRIFLNRIARLT